MPTGDVNIYDIMYVFNLLKQMPSIVCVSPWHISNEIIIVSTNTDIHTSGKSNVNLMAVKFKW